MAWSSGALYQHPARENYGGRELWGTVYNIGHDVIGGINGDSILHYCRSQVSLDPSVGHPPLSAVSAPGQRRLRLKTVMNAPPELY